MRVYQRRHTVEATDGFMQKSAEMKTACFKLMNFNICEVSMSCIARHMTLLPISTFDTLTRSPFSAHGHVATTAMTMACRGRKEFLDVLH